MGASWIVGLFPRQVIHLVGSREVAAKAIYREGTTHNGYYVREIPNRFFVGSKYGSSDVKGFLKIWGLAGGG
jgi:hypothetical protein